MTEALARKTFDDAQSTGKAADHSLAQGICGRFIRRYLQGGQKQGLKIGPARRMVRAMMMLAKTPANQRKMAQLRGALGKMLAEVLRRGFFGTAGVELVIQDGTIQSIRRKVERIER